MNKTVKQVYVTWFNSVTYMKVAINVSLISEVKFRLWKSYETLWYCPQTFRGNKYYSSVLPEEMRLEMTTSCPVTSYWLMVCTHNVKNSSTMCGNHGNRKLNSYAYHLLDIPYGKAEVTSTYHFLSNTN